MEQERHSQNAYGALFVVSAALLALEVLQVKILAFTLNALQIFSAVGLCLLGLGASATILATIPNMDGRRIRSLAAWSAWGAAITVPVAHAIFARLAGNYESRSSAFAGYLALSVPYLCLGMTIACLMMERSKTITRAYAVNLAGSGLGCLIVFPLLDALGAERALVVIAAMAGVSALLIAPPRGAAGWAAVAALGVVFLALGDRAPGFIEFPPERFGQLNTIRKAVASLRAKHSDDEITLQLLFRRWDRTARIDVVRVDTSIPALQGRIDDPLETLFMVQDSSAGSILLGVGDDLSRGRPFFEGTVYGAGYVARPVADVLIIGLGGGPDVLTALSHDAQAIVGVDINGTIIDMVGSRFAEFVGDPYGQPQVRTHQMDGRTYLRSTGERFDLIQLSGVDTKSLLPSGSLSVNENYIYTREAMREFLGRLKPEGILSIVRFGDFDVHRVASIAIVGLRDRGTAHPERHIVALAQGLFRCVLVKREPFTTTELDRIREWVERQAAAPPRIVIPAYDWIGVGMSHPVKILYSPDPRPVAATDFFEALAAGRYDAFVATAERDLSAPDDNRPYFFLGERPVDALRSPPWYLTALYWNILQLGLVAAIFILTPLIVMRRRGLGASGSSRALVHFLCLGAAFMFVEIGLIQRFVLLLGHQSYAVTVVLFGLLLGASIGSIAAGRMSLGSRRPLTLALSGLTLAILICAFGLGPFLEAAAGLRFGARLTLALAILVILGIPMGMPFPLALAALRASNAPLVPWGIGVNAFASVIASTTAVPIALMAGLRTLVVVGAVLYVLALLTSPVGRAAAPSSA